jgi:hypothetical protein
MKGNIRRIGWAAVLGLMIPAAVSTAALERDLSGYDKLAFDYTTSTAPALLDRQLQNFIYTHWKQRRRAFALVKIITLDGKNRVDIVKQLFVEPARNGSWCIRGMMEASLSELRWVPASQRKPPRQMAAQFEAVSAEWAGGDRHLVLKDKTGKMVDSF